MSVVDLGEALSSIGGPPGKELGSDQRRSLGRSDLANTTPGRLCEALVLNVLIHFFCG